MTTNDENKAPATTAPVDVPETLPASAGSQQQPQQGSQAGAPTDLAAAARQAKSAAEALPMAELHFRYEPSPTSAGDQTDGIVGYHMVMYRVINTQDGQVLEEKEIEVGNSGKFSLVAPVGFYLQFGLFYRRRPEDNPNKTQDSRMRQWDDIVPEEVPPLPPCWKQEDLTLVGVSKLQPVDLTITTGAEAEAAADLSLAPAESVDDAGDANADVAGKIGG